MYPLKKFLAPAAGIFNRARLGFPSHFFQGTGGIGDDLMCTTVFRELKKRGAGRIALTTRRPEIFQGNGDVDKIIFHPHPRLNSWLHLGLRFNRLAYADYDPVRDMDIAADENVLVTICRLAGITGRIDLRPYFFLTPQELAAGKIAGRQIAIQTSGLAAPYPMRNKEWYQNRFQEVCSALKVEVQIVQIGAAQDPQLEGAIDLRGKTTVRESAAILANSLVFIGLEGFLMHLARAVDCRAVIIYGGRIKPSQIGYVANKNIYSPVHCSPCWLRNPCAYDRKCMDIISAPQVIAAAAEQIRCFNTPMEVQTAEI